jgi:hypothetical protein
MSAQTTVHSLEFQAIIAQVETALAQAAEDARELAERTSTPLIVRDMQGIEPASETGAREESREGQNRSTG